MATHRDLFQRRVSRRRYLTMMGLGAAAASLTPAMRRNLGVAAQDVHIVDEKTGQVVETIGESQATVYVEQTGHTMSSVLLDYWRVTGRDWFFGNPISEPFETEDGVWSQVMENGVVQYVPELMFTLEPFVRFMPIGRTMLAERNTGFRADGRRAGGGGIAPAGNWALPPGTQLDGWVGAYGDFGAPVAEPFENWYWANQGRFYLGFPLTGLTKEMGRPAQWFEGGLVIEGDDGPRIAPMGEEIAARLGIDTAPVSGDGLPTDSEALFLGSPNPFPTMNDPAGPGPKHLYVNLNQQRIDAYAGENLVLSSPVATGLWPNKTENGNFRIRAKKVTEDMRGATDANDKVVWLVTDGGSPPPGSIPYGVADVPNVMYINLQAEALHGAYWHNEFGQTRSHGCINLPVEVSKFLYDWAPLGTPTTVFLEDGKVYPGAENATEEELRIAAEDSTKAGGV